MGGRKDPGIRQLPSGRWQATWRGPDGTQHGRTFDTKRDARAFRDAQLVDIRRGAFIDPRGPQVLLGEWVELWLELRQVRPTTAATTRWILRQHLLPTFGRIRLGAITRAGVQGWVKDLEDAGLATATVRKCYATLAQVMAAAVDEDLIGKSPCRGIRFDPAGRAARVPRALSVAEATRLLEALADTPPAHTLVLTMLGSGLRWGEAVGLRRRHVHLLRRPPHVEVAESLHEVAGKLYMGPPKTRASLRRVPLPAMVAQALAAHMPAGGDPEDLVFSTPRGMPWRRRNFATRYWLPALEATGLGSVHVHDLRHSYASWLADAEVPEVLIATVLGHRIGPSITAHYVQAVAGFEARIIAALDERLSVAEGGFGVGS